MAELHETELPGIGVRYDFTSATGARLGVLVHRGGRRDLLVYRDRDPDACGAQLRLDEDDARTLAMAVLARLADRVGLSPIPGYLLIGLALSEGGLVGLDVSLDFIGVMAEIGVILLLLLLGIEYTPAELRRGVRRGAWPGIVDVVLNATPGVAMAWLLGWSAPTALLLAGITYVSSSGIIAKLLSDLGRLGNRETPTVINLLVTEDLVMAAYLPIVGVVLAGRGISGGLASLAGALAVASVILVVALRDGDRITATIGTRNQEGLLLGVLGLALVVAGVAQWSKVSAAVGAFLVGLALSGPVSQQARQRLEPLRDVFAAAFFLFFGLQLDPATLPPVLAPALALAAVTAATKIATGMWSAGREGIGRRGRVRAGTALVARGEFSVVIADLGVVAGATMVDPDLGAFAGAYVLVLAVAGPLLARFAEPIADRLPTGRPA